MFNFFKKKEDEAKKNLSSASPKTVQAKPIMVAIHGFGVRRGMEFQHLINAFQDEYEIITPDLYDIHDETDHDWTHWVARADACIRHATSRGSIVLVGYSMGGVIAAYLSNRPHIEKLVLIAPAFEFMHLQNILSVVLKQKDHNEKKVSLPDSFYPPFIQTVKNCRHRVARIEVPVLLIHGTEDEIIQVGSSKKAFEKIPSEKKACVLIQGGDHFMMDKLPYRNIVFETIRSFLNDRFF